MGVYHSTLVTRNLTCPVGLKIWACMFERELLSITTNKPPTCPTYQDQRAPQEGFHGWHEDKGVFMDSMKIKLAAIKQTIAMFLQESLLVLLAQLDARFRSVLTRGVRAPAAAFG